MSASVNKLIINLSIMTMRAGMMAARFGLAFFIAHYLDLSTLGLYGLLVGAVAIIPTVVNIGMNHVLLRDAVTASPDDLTNNLRHYWSFVTALYVALFALVVAATIWFDTPALWIATVPLMWLEHVGYDIFSLLSNLRHHVAANLNAFLRGAAWIFVYAPLAIWEPQFRTLPHLLCAWMIGGALSVALFAYTSRSWPWRASLRRPLEPAIITRTVRRSYMFCISDLSFVVSQYLDRYLVTLFLGVKAAGVYFLFWTVANSASSFVTLVVQQQQRPLLIHAYSVGGYQQHGEAVWRFMQTTTLATAALSVVVGVAFQVFLPWLGQPLLAQNLPAFWLIVAGMGCRALADFEAMGLFTAHRDRLTTLTNIVSVGVLAATQLVLLPLMGLYGAGAAILVTFIGIAIWRYRLLFDHSLTSRSKLAHGDAA